jgi:tetratricopeptide (TPR) repeat protein
VPSEAESSETEASAKELQAMTDFGKAETALARGDMATTEGLAKKAADADPEIGDYLALWAYAKAMRGKPSAAPESIAILDQVIQKEPSNDRAILYRARLHKRVSQNAQALKDFESVLELNPTHREAASEARLLRTRLKR